MDNQASYLEMKAHTLSTGLRSLEGVLEAALVQCACADQARKVPGNSARFHIKASELTDQSLT